ncbi:MAG: hypothetical protein PF508_08405 [Spirochaeta sp.]|nr:hypothetical protein [Spirochaeta sp.]
MLISCDPMGDLYPGDGVEKVGYGEIGINRVPDGGFENGLDSWEARSRDGYVASNFQVNTDPEFALSGDQSIQIVGKTWYYTQWRNPARDLPMTVSVWVKGPGGSGSLSVFISQRPDVRFEDEEVLRISGSHPEWTEYSADVDSVYKYWNGSRLQILSTGTPNLYIDDVEAIIRDK